MTQTPISYLRRALSRVAATCRGSSVPAKRRMVPLCLPRGAERRVVAPPAGDVPELPRQCVEQLTRTSLDKVKLNCRAKAVLEDSRCNRMVGMRAQPGIAHVSHHLVGSQILGQCTGAIEVRLHASIERRQPPLQHASLINRKVECRRTAIRKKRIRTLGGGIHAMVA